MTENKMKEDEKDLKYTAEFMRQYMLDRGLPPMDSETVFKKILIACLNGQNHKMFNSWLYEDIPHIRWGELLRMFRTITGLGLKDGHFILTRILGLSVSGGVLTETKAPNGE